MQILYPIEFRQSLEVRLDNSNLGPEHEDVWVDIFKLEDLSFLDQLNLLIALGDFFTFMPQCSSRPNGEIKSEILKHEIRDRVTFFAGTFFPFHQGHMSCLDLCPEENIIVVLDCNPEKEEIGEESNPFFYFLELCQKLKPTRFSIYPGFLGRNRPNPTSRWLPNVKISEKNFIMGDDLFMRILNWERPEIFINSLSKLYVVPRIYSMSNYQYQIEALRKINPNLQVIVLPDHPNKHFSSTELKKKKL